jgi:hypothetical protein
MKKVVLVLAVAFVIYYVLHSPQVAGKSLHAVGSGTWHGVKAAAASMTKFFNSLFT